MSAQEECCVPLVDFSQPVNKKKKAGWCRRESCIKVGKLVAYFSVLLWRLVGLALFGVHVTDCLFREKHASYHCNNFTLFSHAYELEIAWQASSILNTLIVLAVWRLAFGNVCPPFAIIPSMPDFGLSFSNLLALLFRR